MVEILIIQKNTKERRNVLLPKHKNMDYIIES